jgi:hypothetical protein
MNLNQTPTKDQLKALLSAAHDDDDHHILWVDISGEVRVTPLGDEITPAGWEGKQPSTALRYETFVAGNGYVGADAAADDSHVDRLYRSLVSEWADRKPADGARYIDHF